MAMLMNKQIKQISQFLSAYPADVVEAGIEAWRTGEIPEMEGRVTDIPLAQNYNDLDDDAKKFVKEESKRMQKLMPYCPKCKTQYGLTGVCPSCKEGQEGYKTKLVCPNPLCRNEELFKDTFQEKIQQLLGGI